MIQTIYVMVMAMYPQVFEEKDTIDRHVESATGPGCCVHACHFYNDPIVRQVLLNLDAHNRHGPPSLSDFKMDLELMELVVESCEPITHQVLPWLDEHLKKYFSLADHTNSAGYFFYLIKDQDRLRFNVAAMLQTMTTVMDETDCGDDFSYLDEVAPLMDRYLYHQDAEVVFPAQLAKLYLQFGE